MLRLYSHPRLILLLLSVMVVGLGHRAIFLPLDNSPRTFFAADQQALESYQAFTETFGPDEVVWVELRGADYREGRDLALLARLTREMSSLPHVAAVFSLAQAYDRPGQGPVEELYPELVERVVREAEALSLYSKMGLVRPRIPSLGVLALIALPPQGSRLEVTRRLTDAVNRVVGDRYQVLMAGQTTVYAAFDRETRRAITLFMPVIVIFIILIGFILFRSPKAMVALILPPAGAVAMGAGALEMAGESLNLVTSTMPPLTLAIGIAAAIHIVTHTSSLIGQGLSSREAALMAMRDKLLPTTLALGTTALGFGSLALSDVRSVRVLGLATAGTLVVSLALVILATPALLIWLQPRLPSPPHRRRMIEALAIWSIRHRPFILAGAALLIAGLAMGLPRLRASINGTMLLDEDLPERRAYETLEAEGRGLASLDLWIKMPLTDERALLQAADRLVVLASRLEAIPRVTATLGVHDLLRFIQYRITGDPGLPATLFALELLTAQARQDIERRFRLFWSPQEGLRLSLFTLTVDREEEFRALGGEILSLGREAFPEATLEVTGYYAMLISSPGRLMATLLESLGLTVVLVTFLFLILLRSVPLALAGMATNLLPVLAVVGVMAWFDIPIDVSTVMTGSVVFGLAVDDTFHYLYHRKKSGSIVCAASIAGMGIVATSLVIAGGFSSLALSGFTPILRFGLLTAMAAIMALVVDSMVLPALTGRKAEMDQDCSP